jgi:hypothetical protein
MTQAKERPKKTAQPIELDDPSLEAAWDRLKKAYAEDPERFREAWKEELEDVPPLKPRSEP